MEPEPEVADAPRIRAAVDAVDVGRAIELTRQFCQVPSILGNEGPLAALIESVLRDSSFEDVQLQPVLPDRPNAIGFVDFGPGPLVVLTGHMDTKPVSHGWSETEPFSGDVVDGRVYGHGIMDMKAALACEIVALEAVRDAGLPLRGSAAMAAVSDHMGDQRGSIAFFEQHPADLCILGELSDNEIYLGHRGRQYYDITVYGRSAHTCHKPAAINANALAAHAILELEASALKPDLEAWVEELFGPETFISPGRVYGGLPPGGPSMIPDECVIRVDARLQPGVTTEVVRAEIDRCLARASERDPRFSARVELVDDKPSYLAPADSGVVDLIVRAVSGVSGTQPALKAAGWLGDTASFGTQVPTVILGPGHEPVYCANENLPITDLEYATKVYAAFLALALAPDRVP